jgi:hypothetical protein
MMTKTLATVAIAFAIMIPLASAATPICVPPGPRPIFACGDPGGTGVFREVCQPIADFLNSLPDHQVCVTP